MGEPYPPPITSNLSSLTVWELHLLTIGSIFHSTHNITSHGLQSPTLGAHTHARGFWVGMGAMLLFMGGHRWATILCIPASNSKSESNFSDRGREFANKETLQAEASGNERFFICPIQPRLGVGG